MSINHDSTEVFVAKFVVNISCLAEVETRRKGLISLSYMNGEAGNGSFSIVPVFSICLFCILLFYSFYLLLNDIKWNIALN